MARPSPASTPPLDQESPLSNSYADLLPSENLAIHVYTQLAQLHKHAMIPYLPRVMSSLLSSLSFSPRLHHACSAVVSSLASHTIDPSRNPTSNEEALRSLCKPLLSSLSCPNLLLSAGSASCLRALVESEPWRCAPLDLQELLCARGTMALEFNLELDGENVDYHTVSLLCLMKSLTELSSSIVIQGYGARLLKLSMEILQNSSSSLSSSSSSSWEKKVACAKLLESILKVADSDLLDLDLSPIMGALEGHKMEKTPNSPSSSSSSSTIKPLQSSQKHNVSLYSGTILHRKYTRSPVSEKIQSCEQNLPQLSDTVLSTPRHGPTPWICISSSPAPLEEDSFHIDGDDYMKEKENESSIPDLSGRHRFYIRRKIHHRNPSRRVLNPRARMSDLLLSENRSKESKPNSLFGKSSNCKINVCANDDADDDQFCLSTIDRCMLQSDEVNDGRRSFNMLKEALAYNGNEKLYSPDSDKCESGVSSEHGTPQLEELLSEDMLSTPAQQIQRDEDSSTSEWEEQGSDCSNLEASFELRHESLLSSGHDYSTMDTVSQVSHIISQGSDTISQPLEFAPDLQLGDRYPRNYIDSQTVDLDSNLGSSYSRYADEDDYVQVNSPVSQASNQSLGLTYTEGNDVVISRGSSISRHDEFKSVFLTRASPPNKVDDSAGDNTAEVRSAVPVNCVFLLYAQEPKTIIKSPSRNMFRYLVNLLKNAKMVMELLFSLFICYIVALHLIEYLLDARELPLVPT